MPFGNYTAATNDFQVNAGFTQNSDYVIYNNTATALIVSFPNGGVGGLEEFVLEPGEAYAYHHTASNLSAANNNVNGRPLRSSVGTNVAAPLKNNPDGSPHVNESLPRLVVGNY